MEGNHATTEGTSSPGRRESEWPEFVAFYRANVGTVYAYLHRRCRDTAMAEDLTQDVFLAVIRSGRPAGELGVGWLITAARHQLIDVARRADRYSEKLRLLRGGLDDTEPDVATVDRIVLAQALGRLSVDQRLVLTLHYLDGLKVAELAQHLGRSVKSAEGLMTRARRNLRRELEQSDA